MTAQFSYRRLTAFVAQQGFIGLRSLARYGLIEPDAREVGCEPGFGCAADMARQVAGLCLFPRYLRVVSGAGSWYGGRFQPEYIIAVSWHMSDRFGRQWLESKLSDFTRVPAGELLDPVIAALSADEDLGGLRQHWIASARVLHEGLAPRDRQRPTAAAVCESVAVEGLCQIYARTHETSGTGDGEAWRDIEVVADACHRLPVFFEFSGWVAGPLSRSQLRDAWGRTGPAGRQWMRDAAARLSFQHADRLRQITHDRDVDT